VALRRPKPFTAYDEVALSAAILRDEDLVTYLRDVFLAPLSCSRVGGDALQDTLRAYFESGRNVSSAASVLGVSRQTGPAGSGRSRNASIAPSPAVASRSKQHSRWRRSRVADEKPRREDG
jgi:hypothetical protein